MKTNGCYFEDVNNIIIFYYSTRIIILNYYNLLLQV